MLADAFTPLTERDLFNLPRFRMAIRTELEGETRILTADVLREPPRLGSSDAVRRLSATSATGTPRARCAMDEHCRGPQTRSATRSATTGTSGG